MLLELSDGGADATVVREFDLQTKVRNANPLAFPPSRCQPSEPFSNTFIYVFTVVQAFVPEGEQGFVIHEAKQRVFWKDADTLLVGTDMKSFGRDTVTESGYPRLVYQWRRGTPLTSAKVVYEGEKADVAVMSYVSKHRNFRVGIRYRSLTFYTSKKLIKV